MCIRDNFKEKKACRGCYKVSREKSRNSQVTTTITANYHFYRIFCMHEWELCKKKKETALQMMKESL